MRSEPRGDPRVEALLRAWLAVIGSGRWVTARELVSDALDDRSEVLIRAFEGLDWRLHRNGRRLVHIGGTTVDGHVLVWRHRHGKRLEFCIEPIEP